MNLHSFLDRLPWWIDPRLPMGRSSYLLNSLGIAFALLIPYIFIVFAYYSSLGQELPEDQNEYLWLFYIIYLVPNLLLQLRRAKAAALPLNVFWTVQGAVFVMSFGGLEDHIITNLFSYLLGLYLLFAPNKIDPVSQNPNSQSS